MQRTLIGAALWAHLACLLLVRACLPSACTDPWGGCISYPPSANTALSMRRHHTGEKSVKTETCWWTAQWLIQWRMGSAKDVHNQAVIQWAVNPEGQDDPDHIVILFMQASTPGRSAHP